MTQVQYKRKKRLINKRMQLKMVGVFTAIGIVSALFQIVLVNSSLLSIAKDAPGGGEYMLGQARPMMMRNVAWTVAALVPLMVCVGIVVTHRVAGPAYRMTQHCLGIAAGEPVRPCKIRKGDELGELCDALNAAIEHLAPSSDEAEAHTAEWNLEETPSLVRSVNAKTEAPTEEVTEPL